MCIDANNSWCDNAKVVQIKSHSRKTKEQHWRLLSTGFGHSLVEGRGALQLATGQLCASSVAPPTDSLALLPSSLYCGGKKSNCPSLNGTALFKHFHSALSQVDVGKIFNEFGKHSTFLPSCLHRIAVTIALSPFRAVILGQEGSCTFFSSLQRCVEEK